MLLALPTTERALRRRLQRRSHTRDGDAGAPCVPMPALSSAWPALLVHGCVLAAQHRDLRLEGVDVLGLRVDLLHQAVPLRDLLPAPRHGVVEEAGLRGGQLGLQRLLLLGQLGHRLQALRVVRGEREHLLLGLLDLAVPLPQLLRKRGALRLELLLQLLRPARGANAVQQLQVNLLPKLEHLHVVRARIQLRNARLLGLLVPQQLLVLLSQLLLLPPQRNLLLVELLDAALEFFELSVAEHQRLAQVIWQLPVHQVLHLVHAERDDDVDLVELALLLLLKLDDVLVDLLQAALHHLLLLAVLLLLLLEVVDALLKLNDHVLLVEPLLADVAHLLVQHLVAARRAHLLVLVVVIEILVLVVLVVLRVAVVVLIVAVTLGLLGALDLAHEDLEQRLTEVVLVVHQLIKLHRHRLLVLDEFVDLALLLVQAFLAVADLLHDLLLLCLLRSQLVVQRVLALLKILQQLQLLVHHQPLDLRLLQVRLQRQLLAAQLAQRLVKRVHHVRHLARELLHLALVAPPQ
mmetsp:Transcript_13639/g.35020  ORF Transcript_13639/g.35020 Transcript_13639/m.35020 type:complete len:520 (+) Transcript_13639:40-1599(+)